MPNAVRNFSLVGLATSKDVHAQGLSPLVKGGLGGGASNLKVEVAGGKGWEATRQDDPHAIKVCHQRALVMAFRGHPKP